MLEWEEILLKSSTRAGNRLEKQVFNTLIYHLSNILTIRAASKTVDYNNLRQQTNSAPNISCNGV